MSEMTNEQKFFSIYVEELKKEITKDNSSYAYGIDQAEEVGLRMVRALKEKSANLSNPIKRTAKKKKLGIKPTISGIWEYLNA